MREAERDSETEPKKAMGMVDWMLACATRTADLSMHPAKSRFNRKCEQQKRPSAQGK